MGNEILKRTRIYLITPQEVIIDKGQRLKIIEDMHKNAILGGHFGYKKTYAKIRSNYYWKNMTRDISNFIKICEECKKSKVRQSYKENMKLVSSPQKAFDLIIIDTIYWKW